MRRGQSILAALGIGGLLVAVMAAQTVYEYSSGWMAGKLRRNEMLFTETVSLFRELETPDLRQISLWGASESCVEGRNGLYSTLDLECFLELMEAWGALRELGFDAVDTTFADNGSLVMVLSVNGGTIHQGGLEPYYMRYMLVWIDPDCPVEIQADAISREWDPNSSEPIYGENWYYWSRKAYYG